LSNAFLALMLAIAIAAEIRAESPQGTKTFQDIIVTNG